MDGIKRGSVLVVPERLDGWDGWDQAPCLRKANDIVEIRSESHNSLCESILTI